MHRPRALLIACVLTAAVSTAGRARVAGDREATDFPDWHGGPFAAGETRSASPDGGPAGMLEPESLLEVPRDPRASAEVLARRRVEPAMTRRLGSFASVQVNVDDLGNNIRGDAANEPSLAVSPVDPLRVVVGWRQFDSVTSDFREAGFAVSKDGGATWSQEGVLQEGVFRSDPVLQADADGSFYYYSLKASSAANPGGFRVWQFKSTDGGETWSQPVNAFGGDKEWYTVDRTGGSGRGNVYGAWNSAFSCCQSRDFSRSVNGGASFEAPITMPSPKMRWGTLDVDPEGTLYLAGALNTTTPFPAPGQVFARSLNARNSSVTPVFDLVRQIDLGGATVMGGINGIGLVGQVWIAADGSGGPNRGNLYVLASVVPSERDPADVMLIRSADGGQTWSSPIRINDDPPGNGAWHWFGTLAVAPNGRIDVIWNDTRNHPGQNLSEVMYSHSLDGGRTWSANAPVSPAFDPHAGYPMNNKLGDYYQMVSDDGGASLAYAATFNGEQDVYFLRIPFDCDGNGIEDDCDLSCGARGGLCAVAGCGTGSDRNGNGILDRCENSPPHADAGADQIVECSSPAGAAVRLDGSASTDPDGDPLLYTWTGDFGEAEGAEPVVTLSLGVHIVTLQVDDGRGGIDTDEVVITVRDTTPPVVTCEGGANPHGGEKGDGGAGADSPGWEAGFYRLTAVDLCGPDPPVLVTDLQGSGPFGPFASGTQVKITETPGGKASARPMGGPRGAAGAVLLHLNLPSDAVVRAVDPSGNAGSAVCPAPPSR